MAVKISIFALVLVVAIAVTEAQIPTTLTLNSPYGLTYYPKDSQTYNELKKSLYALALAVGNACFSSQASYDYLSFYNYQGVYQSKLSERISKLQNAEQYLHEAYLKYQQDLANYKNSLAIPNPTVSLNDNVNIKDDYV